MVKMQDIVERIKDVISKDFPKDKVLDKNVAHELGISPGALAVQKTRDLVPYDELTMFCIKRKVNLNWLFFGLGKMEMDYAKQSL